RSACIVDRHADSPLSNLIAHGSEVELPRFKMETDRSACIRGEKGDLPQEDHQLFSVDDKSVLDLFRNDPLDIRIGAGEELCNQKMRAIFQGELVLREEKLRFSFGGVEKLDHLFSRFQGDDERTLRLCISMERSGRF